MAYRQVPEEVVSPVSSTGEWLSILTFSGVVPIVLSIGGEHFFK